MREKYGEKWNFLLFGSREKIIGKENGVENFPFKPTKSCPPNWEKN